jgi:hypothetical protein
MAALWQGLAGWVADDGWWRLPACLVVVGTHSLWWGPWIGAQRAGGGLARAGGSRPVSDGDGDGDGGYDCRKRAIRVRTNSGKTRGATRGFGEARPAGCLVYFETGERGVAAHGQRKEASDARRREARRESEMGRGQSSRVGSGRSSRIYSQPSMDNRGMKQKEMVDSS